MIIIGALLAHLPDQPSGIDCQLENALLIARQIFSPNIKQKFARKKTFECTSHWEAAHEREKHFFISEQTHKQNGTESCSAGNKWKMFALVFMFSGYISKNFLGQSIGKKVQ